LELKVISQRQATINSYSSLRKNSEDQKKNGKKKTEGDVNYAVLDLKNIIEYQ